MVSQKVFISNPTGLHARPAHKLIKFLKQFESEVVLGVGEAEVNCASIVHLLTAGIKQGTTVEVKVAGADEAAALAQIVGFLEALTE